MRIINNLQCIKKKKKFNTYIIVLYNNSIYNVIVLITVSVSRQLIKNGNNKCHMWPVRSQKWCEDNSVVPFLAIPVLYYFWGLFGKSIRFYWKTVFPLYNMHIIVFIASEIRENCRLLNNSVLNVFLKGSTHFRH